MKNCLDGCVKHIIELMRNLEKTCLIAGKFENVGLMDGKMDRVILEDSFSLVVIFIVRKDKL